MEIKNHVQNYKVVGVIYLTNKRLVFSRYPTKKKHMGENIDNYDASRDQPHLQTFEMCAENIQKGNFKFQADDFF
eukprot:Pgem_evm1s13916